MHKKFISLVILLFLNLKGYSELPSNNLSLLPTELLHKSESKNWGNYFQDTLNFTDPHHTLLLAQNFFHQENKRSGIAADLGAGTGRDTLFLLKQGWNVLALDGEQQSIDIILNRADASYLKSLDAKEMSFSNMMLPKGLDLINASYSLPFCKSQDFPQCWKTIVDQLAIGGRFSGHFFGEKQDTWGMPDLTIHSYGEVIQLFKNQFIIEYLHIEDRVKPAANGEMKQWHVYHVVAKKIN